MRQISISTVNPIEEIPIMLANNNIRNTPNGAASNVVS